MFKKLFLAAILASAAMSAPNLAAAKTVMTYSVDSFGGEKFAADTNGNIIIYNPSLINTVTYTYSTPKKTYNNSSFKWDDLPTTWVKTFEIIALSRNYVLVKYTDNKDPALVQQTAYGVFIIRINGMTTTAVVQKDMQLNKYHQLGPDEYLTGMNGPKIYSNTYDDKGQLRVIRTYNTRFLENSSKAVNGQGNLSSLNPPISAYFVDLLYNPSATSTVNILKY